MEATEPQLEAKFRIPPCFSLGKNNNCMNIRGHVGSSCFRLQQSCLESCDASSVQSIMMSTKAAYSHFEGKETVDSLSQVDTMDLSTVGKELFQRNVLNSALVTLTSELKDRNSEIGIMVSTFYGEWNYVNSDT